MRHGDINDLGRCRCREVVAGATDIDQLAGQSRGAEGVAHPVHRASAGQPHTHLPRLGSRAAPEGHEQAGVIRGASEQLGHRPAHAGVRNIRNRRIEVFVIGTRRAVGQAQRLAHPDVEIAKTAAHRCGRRQIVHFHRGGGRARIGRRSAEGRVERGTDDWRHRIGSAGGGAKDRRARYRISTSGGIRQRRVARWQTHPTGQSPAGRGQVEGAEVQVIRRSRPRVGDGRGNR